MTEQEFKRLERQAYDGSINVDPLPAPEYRYFDRLRRLYERYKFDKMPREFAEHMKQIAYSEYMQDIEEHKRYTSMYAQYQYNIKRSERLKIQVNKAKSDHDKLIPALKAVGLLTDDESFYRINMEE